MASYRIEENQLVIAEEVRGQFVFAHEDYGSAVTYSADTLIVFYDEVGTKIFPITPATFKWLKGAFFILNGFLYHGIFKLGKINANGICGCTEFYVWDDRTVYYLNGPVGEADSATFEDLGDYWAQDRQNVFYQNRLIKEAERTSFRKIDDIFTVDADQAAPSPCLNSPSPRLAAWTCSKSANISTLKRASDAILRSRRVDGFPNHLVFYRSSTNGVEILRVLHGARDLERLLDE